MPVLFTEARQIRHTQRRLLDVLGLLLARVQGKMPVSGVVYYGHECKASTVRLTTGLKSAVAIAEDLVGMHQAAASQLLVEVERDTRSFEMHCPPRSAPTAR